MRRDCSLPGSQSAHRHRMLLQALCSPAGKRVSQWSRSASFVAWYSQPFGFRVRLPVDILMRVGDHGGSNLLMSWYLNVLHRRNNESDGRQGTGTVMPGIVERIDTRGTYPAYGRNCDAGILMLSKDCTKKERRGEWPYSTRTLRTNVSSLRSHSPSYRQIAENFCCPAAVPERIQ